LDAAAPCGETLVFDVETQRLSDEVGGWDHIRRMGLAAAVVYSVEADSYTTYLEPDVAALVDRLASARLVIGFNVMRFDYEVLLAYTTHPLRSLPTLDIMVELQRHLGFRPSLASVASGTLGAGKSADGVQSVQWFRQGLIDKVIAYCTEDVRLTAELYRFGRTKGHVLMHDRVRGVVRVPVRW
jgi:DEAD/DEAH box helicase domain-containing protein